MLQLQMCDKYVSLTYHLSKISQQFPDLIGICSKMPQRLKMAKIKFLKSTPLFLVGRFLIKQKQYCLFDRPRSVTKMRLSGILRDYPLLSSFSIYFLKMRYSSGSFLVSFIGSYYVELIPIRTY